MPYRAGHQGAVPHGVLRTTPRVGKSFKYFLDTQQEDGGWKCKQYRFGPRGGNSVLNPVHSCLVLDLMRYSPYFDDARLDKAVDFLLEHWVVRKPISPCHYGIGTLFMQVEYPFRGYNLFYYVYVWHPLHTREPGGIVASLKPLRRSKPRPSTVRLWLKGSCPNSPSCHFAARVRPVNWQRCDTGKFWPTFQGHRLTLKRRLPAAA